LNRRVLAILLVILTVGLNLVSAVVLKETVNRRQGPLFLIALLIVLVVMINFVRVVLWSAIHKRFRLSESYPLTSLFFPMILVLSAIYGEEIGLANLIGTGMVTLGVLVLMKDKKLGANATGSSANIKR